LLRRKFIAVHQVYTFGGPMIGNDEVVRHSPVSFPRKSSATSTVPIPSRSCPRSA
jgi:hypothetical protein